MPAERRQLDTTVEVVTPENIAFQYRVAGPFRRSVAYLLDLFVRVFVCILAAFVISVSFGLVGVAGFGMTILFMFFFGIMWFYGPLLETYWNGQTVGKRTLGLRVLTIDGQPINGLQAVARNLLRAVDCQPFLLYLLGVLAAASNRRFQRLGDLACGTMVVVEERSWVYGLVRLDDPAVVQLAGELPPKFEISRSLGQALAAYVERRRYFSPARRADIARHVGEPLRIRCGLPPQTSHDLLLCALYYHTFITDRDYEETATGAAAAAPAEPAATAPLAAGTPMS